MKTIIKVLFWTILGLVLTIAATLICAIRVLTPDVLTPLVERTANSMINGHLSLGRVEIGLKPAFPLLNLRIDSLTLISHALESLPPERRASLPLYADTLCRFDRFEGAIDLASLARGNIAIQDVSILRPGVNIVLADEGVNNFDIVPPSDSTDTDDTPAMIPPLSLKRFSLDSPRALRFFNAADSTDATILLLAEAGLEGSSAPEYRLHIDGRLNSPIVREMIDIEDLRLGLDGRVRWDPAQPSLVSIEDFRLRGAGLSMNVDATTTFDEAFTVNSARMSLEPVRVDSLLGFLPKEMLKKYGLTSPRFTTDATVAVEAEILKPFNLDTDTIPYASIAVTVAPSKLTYGKARFDNLAADILATLRGNDADSTTVEVRKFTVSGPATALELRATAGRLLSDPSFTGCLKGHTDISKLPPVVADLARGYISGRLDMDFDFEGSMSMLDKNSFHRLNLSGEVTGRKLYYLSNDTGTMAEINRADIHLGTNRHIRDTSGRRSGRLLSARITVDSANILSGGVDIRVGDFSIGVAGQNLPPKADSTVVIPMGGGLKVGRFTVLSITDTAGMRLRNLQGRVTMTRYQDNARLPQFSFNLVAERLAAGSKTTRLLLSDAGIDFKAHKLPRPRMPKRLARMVDSIAQVHPDLAPDSVYRLALARRRHRPGEHPQRRVHGEMTAEDNEIIDWGTSRGLRKFLLGWDLEGSIATRRARLFTPMFPLRNRISNLDITFNSDTIRLNDVHYKGGHSGMTINGLISNIRRTFTSRGYRSPLKINFDIESDTVDVNEIAAAAFAGAAYSERLAKGLEKSSGFADETESDLDKQIDALASEHPDSVGPLLIPTNVEANIQLRANNILYSDLMLNRLRGEILVYDGAVNLHNLRARSDIGSVNLTALYSAPSPKNMKFGFGLGMNQFNVERFLSVVPAIDSIMPLMRDFSGIIDANIAATVDVDSAMNFVLPTLDAAIRLKGDSLRIIDPDTYKMLGKWLMFKDKTDNVIKEMNVELVIRDNVMQLYPFVFNIDRYRLGVQGYNDLAMNFNYHISVLKSPLPFRFGITVKGNPDDFKVRFGGSKFKEGMVAESVGVVDTARVNLIRQIENVFRRGVKNSRFARIEMPSAPSQPDRADLLGDTLSRADSIMLIREGLIPGTVPEENSGTMNKDSSGRGSKKKTGKKGTATEATINDDKKTGKEKK